MEKREESDGDIQYLWLKYHLILELQLRARQLISNPFTKHRCATKNVLIFCSKMTSKAVSTPARNNYANAQSPIASAKRPRSSIERPGTANATGAVMSTPAKPISSTTMLSPAMGSASLAMSPMHPPRAVHREEDEEVLNGDENSDSASWVGRKVDALFSPVLSFLSAAKDEDVAAVTDEDATMEEPPKPEKSNDDDTQPTASTVVCKDSSEEEEYEEAQEMRNIEEDPSSSFEEEEFNPFLFIKHLPPYPMVESLRPPITLPPKDESAPPVTLVLDLDETLVHCTVEPTPDADLQFPVVFHGITYQVHVRLRPHLFDFLEKIKDKYEVIVFTASQQVYANELLNLIDPGKLRIGCNTIVHFSPDYIFFQQRANISTTVFTASLAWLSKGTILRI